MILLAELVSSFMNSALVGSLYALIGLGLTLSIRATRIYNWAYGEFVTIGAYVAAVLTTHQGLGLLASLGCAILAPAGVAILVDESVFKPLSKRGSGSIQIMLASIAVDIMIRYGIYIYAAIASLLMIEASFPVWTISSFLGLQLTSLHLWIIPSTLAIVIGLQALLSKTMLGKQFRAMSDNPELAGVTGIDVTTLRRVGWLMVGAMAGLAGAFWSMYLVLTPEIGSTLMLDAFAAAIVGGRTFYGTVIAGYIIGLAENVGAYLLNQIFGVPTQYKLLIMFSIMIIVLIVRPSGLIRGTLGGVL
jgi:branched-subunit amino acid ABC-type transport system permease component